MASTYRSTAVMGLPREVVVRRTQVVVLEDHLAGPTAQAGFCLQLAGLALVVFDRFDLHERRISHATRIAVFRLHFFLPKLS